MKSVRPTFKLFALVLMISLVALGCSKNNSGDSQKGDKQHIVTTIAQIAEPLSVIGGEFFEISSIMGPGVDPHVYKATASDISLLEKSDAIFYNGLHLEAQMLPVFEEMSKSKPVLAIGEVVDNNRLLMDEEGATDPHIWFDLTLWKDALNAAVEEMKKLEPDLAEKIEKNKLDYFGKMDQLHTEAKEAMAAVPDQYRYLVTAHDAFGYFGHSYNLEVVGLQGLSTESEVGLSDIQNTIDLIVDLGVPAVFVESSVNKASIEAVIEGAAAKGIQVKLGGELFSDAMGAAGTEEGTYLGMYRHNVLTISKALTNEGE